MKKNKIQLQVNSDCAECLLLPLRIPVSCIGFMPRSAFPIFFRIIWCCSAMCRLIYGDGRMPEKKSLLPSTIRKYPSKAAKNGEWKVQLKPLPAGGPFELTIKGKNTIVLKNILVGDVWVCGGQSNMEWPLSRSSNWNVDKNRTDNSNIRLFYVPKNMSMKPLDNTKEANWELCNERMRPVFFSHRILFWQKPEKELECSHRTY